MNEKVQAGARENRDQFENVKQERLRIGVFVMEQRIKTDREETKEERY